MSTRHVEAIRLRYRAGGGGFNARQVARQETLALSLEGVSQMVYIQPERLPPLVRPPRPAKDSKSKTLRTGVRLQNRDP